MLRPWAAWPLNGPTPARTARELLRTAMTEIGVGAHDSDDAQVCGSELADNAYTHGAAPVWLMIWLGYATVAVHISDSAATTPVALPPYDPQGPPQITPQEFDAATPDLTGISDNQIETALTAIERKRGLDIVVQLSYGRCGVTYEKDTKAVWFCLPAPWNPAVARGTTEQYCRALGTTPPHPGTNPPLLPQRPLPPHRTPMAAAS